MFLFFIIILVLSVGLIFLVKKKFSEKNKRTKNKDEYFNISRFEKQKTFDEINSIAEKIKTLKQLEALENKIEKEDEKTTSTTSDKRLEIIEKRVEVLKLAYDLAYIYLSYWQYIVDLELETNLAELSVLGKKIKNEDKEILDKDSNLKQENWFLINPDEEFEPLNEDDKGQLRFLIKFREIVESNVTKELKDKKIDFLVNKNLEIAKIWFDFESKYSPFKSKQAEDELKSERL